MVVIDALYLILSHTNTVIFIDGGEEEKKNLRSDVVQKLTLTKVAKNLATF